MKLWENAYRAIRGGIPAPLKNVGELHLWKLGYLRETGWTRSRRAGSAVDKNGGALPWYTYPAIKFLERRTPKDATVFEFGMGNSTLWWGRHAEHVTTVEHDEAWCRRISASMPDNVDVIFAPSDSDEYVGAASRTSAAFDILVIDGRRRVSCCEQSLAKLSDRGVVIWDDFHREHYQGGSEFLAEAGFKELPFWGLKPMVAREVLTSIFYRQGNCLDI